jgi:hypothetical protein
VTIIRIRWSHGGYKEVDAPCHEGSWAAHPAGLGDDWAVTHVPTGCSATSGEEARARHVFSALVAACRDFGADMSWDTSTSDVIKANGHKLVKETVLKAGDEWEAIPRKASPRDYELARCEMSSAVSNLESARDYFQENSPESDLIEDVLGDVESAMYRLTQLQGCEDPE